MSDEHDRDEHDRDATGRAGGKTGEEVRTLSDFLARLKTRPPTPFKPYAWYNADGDLIECWVSDKPCYGEQVGPLLTVYYANEPEGCREVVGCQVHWASEVLKIEDAVPVEDEGRAVVDRLRAARERAGLSQEEVAARMGCAQSKVSKMEGGTDGHLRVWDLKRYAAAVGLVAWLSVETKEKA